MADDTAFFFSGLTRRCTLRRFFSTRLCLYPSMEGLPSIFILAVRTCYAIAKQIVTKTRITRFSFLHVCKRTLVLGTAFPFCLHRSSAVVARPTSGGVDESRMSRAFLVVMVSPLPVCRGLRNLLLRRLFSVASATVHVRLECLLLGVYDDSCR